MADPLDNLKPFNSETGRQAGRKSSKKGVKHLSTHIQDMLNDPNFELKLKDGTILKEMPMKAILKTAVAKSISGDTRAMDWLAKYGYGQKLIHDFETDIFKEMELKIKVVKDDGTESKREASDSKGAA